MRVSKKLAQLLVAVLLTAQLLPMASAFASSSRYSQSGTFNASGSPMLNPNFTSDQWNKWEMVAWGVFLSNFVVPMADSYESAFSTSSSEGSHGSGLKALNFTQSGDPGANGILKNFLQFAIDNATKVQKDLFVSYYYLDQAGNIIEPSNPADVASFAAVIDDQKDPTKHDIQPSAVSPANFTSVLPYNLADADPATKLNLQNNDISAWIAGTNFGSSGYDDVFGVNSMIYRPWKLLDVIDTFDYPDLIAIPPMANSTLNRPAANIFNSSNEIPKAYAKEGSAHSVKDIAVAKLPIVWLKGSDGTYVKVWDMLDPWDYQVTLTMLAKEVNSDASFDSGVTTKKVWQTVMDNIDKAFDAKTSLKMDCFGNITTVVDGKPLVVIPAAYNKHITTTPMVNLVTSLFLTGPTSGVSGQTLLDTGKMPVKSFWWAVSNENETKDDGTSNFGPGMPAFGWKGASMPNNAVALYFDSDTLAYNTYKDRVKAASTANYYQTTLAYNGVKMFPQAAATLGVLDLDINGNRKFTRGAGISSLVVPRLTLTGLAKAAGLGEAEAANFNSRKEGTKSLMTAVTFQEGIVGLLPASFNEAETSYAQKMTWKNTVSDLLGSPVVIPVAMQSGSKAGAELWSGLARNFVSYYGTTYYPQNKQSELARLSKLFTTNGTQATQSKDVFTDLTKYMMYDGDNKPSLALINHAKTSAMAPYMNVPALGSTSNTFGLPDWSGWVEATGFIWREPKYIQGTSVNTSWLDSTGNKLFKTAFPSMTQRWVKAYPTNRALTSVASYLGMRGDSEFSAAAAPYVYLTYLNLYGVGSTDGQSGVNVSTLNKNPTKFNEKIFDVKGSPLFSYNPSLGTNIKSDADKAREVSNYAYELLSPTGGHEYKRQLLSNIAGNFIYDQYTRAVYGGSTEYQSGGVQQVVTRSQTGFLRFPSLDDNVFTRWFYQDYATVALVLLAIGLVFIIVFGIFRGRKLTWFAMSVVLLVSSVVVIPFVNDIASASMDGLVSNIMKDKTTIWSMSEMIANSNMEDAYLSSELSPEEAQIATDITKSMSIAYSDRSLVLKQDISHKVISMGNFAAYQQFASTRWMLPSILRQFTADDSSAAYLYVPVLDMADDAANAYWWYNPKDAQNSDGIAASDLQARYAVGTTNGTTRTEYTETDIKEFYPNYHWTPNGTADASTKSKLSYRSLTQSVTGSLSNIVPIHDYIYIYMNNAVKSITSTRQQPLIPVRSRNVVAGVSDNYTNAKYWGDPDMLNETAVGGAGSYIASLQNYGSTLTTSYDALWHGALPLTTTPATPATPVSPTSSKLNGAEANTELLQTAQKYVRDQRDTMYGEFAYLWSTETQYPYFYALVKDTMDAMGKYDYQTGIVNNAIGTTPAGATQPIENTWDAKDKRMGLVLNALTGSPHVATNSATNPDLNAFYGTSRSNFMFQSGITGADLSSTYPNATLPNNASGSTQPLFTGYGRDVLDLESMFYNVIPYMYQMNLVTGGLTGEHTNDKGMFGGKTISEAEYRTYKGLPQSWLYRCNWATKIVEAPQYNKAESIGYYVGDKKVYADVTMTYFPEAYHAVKDNGRDMIFSEAQLKMSGLDENDLTTLELKLIRLNKDVSNKWTTLINYVNSSGVTSEVICRQMALDAMTSFNQELTPKGLGNSAFALLPSTVDLRSLSFDTVMRVILLNTSKDSNFFGTDAMESTITEFGMFSGISLLVTSYVCVYGVTIMRAFFLAFLFLMGVFGVARGVFASNSSKKATLYGYLSNIGILFVLSFFYYEVFNILMTGADSSAYVNSGLQGASATPTVAILLVLAASCLYIWVMWRMFRLALSSVISGSHDLGYGAYKDKAQAGMNKLAKSFNDLRAGHSFDDMSGRINQSRTDSGSFVTGVSDSSAVSLGGSGSTSRKSRSSGTVSTSGLGSGSRVLQGNTTSRGTKAVTALDDHESVDSVITRGGRTLEVSSPVTNLDDYLSTPSKTDSKPIKK